MNSFNPAALRVGHDPEVILPELRQVIAKVGATNGFIRGNPHGIENCSTFPNPINEMPCMIRPVPTVGDYVRAWAADF